MVRTWVTRAETFWAEEENGVKMQVGLLLMRSRNLSTRVGLEHSGGCVWRGEAWEETLEPGPGQGSLGTELLIKSPGHFVSTVSDPTRLGSLDDHIVDNWAISRGSGGVAEGA